MTCTHLCAFVGKLGNQEFAEKREKQLSCRPFWSVHCCQQVLEEVLKERSVVHILAFASALLEEDGEELVGGGHSRLIIVIHQDVTVHDQLLALFILVLFFILVFFLLILLVLALSLGQLLRQDCDTLYQLHDQCSQHLYILIPVQPIRP